VVLVALLPRSTFTLPPQITRLLTPAPLSFSTSAFERVPLPVVPGADTTWLTPSSCDLTPAFDCAFPRPAGGPVSGAMTLWVTHDVGQTWNRVALPALTGTYCEADAAADGSQRLVMSAANAALDQNAQPCAHSQFFLSDDDGATWRAIAHPSPAPPLSQGGVCFALVTARHLFVETFAYNVRCSGQGLSVLERSDDDGQTWQRADHGLPDGGDRGVIQALDATGETLVTVGATTSGGIATQPDFWVTQDAGASWWPIAFAGPPHNHADTEPPPPEMLEGAVVYVSGAYFAFAPFVRAPWDFAPFALTASVDAVVGVSVGA
jgi:hypothetical protein